MLSMALNYGYFNGKKKLDGSNKKKVKNKDLWIELDSLTKNLKIQWNWVKGHSGDPIMKKSINLPEMKL